MGKGHLFATECELGRQSPEQTAELDLFREGAFSSDSTGLPS